MQRLAHLLTLAMAIALFATVSFAQDGELKIKVTPKQAYVVVDANAIREESQSISLSPGKHTVVVVNYGYKISTQDITIESGKSTPLEVKLDAQGGTVAGPFGDVELKGDERAAVLSNGNTPGYFVGHVDEFNFDWIWHQNLLLPPGTHHLTVTHKGKEVWSGDVNVVANKKVVVYMAKGTQKTVDWPRAEKLKDVPRFKVGIASAQVAVAPVTGSFSSSTANIDCGQSSTLTWNTTETVDANISGIGTGATSGSQSVSPHATTTYDFTSAGPGGKITGTSTVNVNTTVVASLNANPSEVHYRKIGDKVITQDSSTVTWTTSNADSVTVDGQKVDLNGNETVKAEPADSPQVPDGGTPRTIDETKSFALNATNVCGGSSAQTTAMHVTGTVEPIPAVTLQSIFYPTDYPDKKNPQVG